MKILGIIAGRPEGNSEFICKTALKEASKYGAEVEMINLRDLKIKPCVGCMACNRGMFKGGDGACILKDDDMPWLDEKLMESDGMIVVMPCYENGPPSEFKLMCDRMGPSHDYNFRLIAHEKMLAAGKKGMDTRWFKRRPVAFIAHGGSEWTTLGLPTISILAVPLGLKIVDLNCFQWNVPLLFQQDRIELMKRAGRAVAENCGKSLEEMEYVGDPGHCPMCHNSTMILGENADDVTCTVCGVVGKISVADGKIKVDYTPEMLTHSHVTDSGRIIHANDLMNNRKKLEPYDTSLLPQIKADAMAWLPTTKPPKR